MNTEHAHLPRLPRLGAGEPDLQRMVDAANAGGTPLMLLYLDIDHFRSINENMGVEVGDEALAILSDRLQQALGLEARAWRHGSDEFIVAGPRLPGTLPPERVGDALREQIELPMTVLPYTLFLTGTLGIALCPEHADTASGLLQCAESAMEQAKHEGMNLVRLYRRGAAITARSDSIIARQIVNAIQHNELRLFYQPQINAHDGRVVGMETLLRWYSPALGLLVPERFMHVAEKLGVIVQIGDWVLRNAFKQARIWRDWGFDDFEIAVNVSTLQLLRPSFVAEVLEAMQQAGLKLLVHGEVTDGEIDLFDREAVFIDRVMRPLRADFPELKVVFEHITTREAAQYVAEAGPHTAATITAHHLLYNRNAIFMGGLRPHYYCLPVLKREVHRQALVAAATSGSSRFFLGTDSAPHASQMKEASVCGAGCFTALSALELYAEAFDAVGALDKLEGFASHHGPDFYGLPRNTGTVTLRREPYALPEAVPFGDAQLKPLRGGETLAWRQTA